MKYWFIASPYSKYWRGLDEAAVIVARSRALLIEHGIPCFSPVAHSHWVSVYGGLDPHSHDIWLPAEAPFRHYAHGIIVLKMVGWEESYGVQYEIDEFKALGKPVVFMELGVVPEELHSQSYKKLGGGEYDR